jgi:hypothetical protein
VAEFATVLPGRTVARFYQIENKMDAAIRYDLAAAIPVIEEQQTGTAPKGRRRAVAGHPSTAGNRSSRRALPLLDSS